MRKCQVQVFAALSIKEAFFLKKCNGIFCQTIFWFLPNFFPEMFLNLFQRFGCFVTENECPSMWSFQPCFDGLQRPIVINGHEIHGLGKNQER